MIKPSCYFCPIPGCQHHTSSYHPIPIPSRETLIHHLTTTHSNQFHTADPTICHTCNLHLCPSCPNRVFKTSTGLSNHFHREHHRTRTDTNSQICQSLITDQNPSPHPPNWSSGLQFIHDHIDPLTYGPIWRIVEIRILIDVIVIL